MSFTTIGVKLAVIMLITLSDGAPIAEEPKQADIGKDSFLPQLKANVEGNFAKFMEKTAEDAFLNLKLYRFKSSDSDKSNIMKIFSPRKQNKFTVSVKWPKNEQTTLSDIADLVKIDATTPSNDVGDNAQKNADFQDVSLVHDPMNLGIELTNDIENFETSTNSLSMDTTMESYLQPRESEEFVTTERTLDEESTTTEARVSMMNEDDLSEIRTEPTTSLPTETPATEQIMLEMKADEKDESSTERSTSEIGQNMTGLSDENSKLRFTTEEPHQETSTKEVSSTNTEPKQNSAPEEIHIQIAPKEWLALETGNSSKEENEETIIGNTENPSPENDSLKITAPIKRSANPKPAVEPPRRGIFQLFPNAVTTTKKQMHGKPLKESTEKHSAVNHQKATTEQSVTSEKPTSVTTVPTTIVTTEKEHTVGLSVEGSRTDPPQTEVKVEENERITETVNANQNADESKGEMVGTTLNESESSVNTQKATTEQSVTSEKPTSVTTVPTTIVTTEKEHTVGLSVEGSRTDPPQTEVKVEENERTTETVNANQNADESKGEMVGTTLNKSESSVTTQHTNIHLATESITTQVVELTTSKTVNVGLDLVTTETEIAKPTESSSEKDSIVGSVQDQVVATITEENSSPVTELPIAQPATKGETTTVSTIESKPVTTVDNNPKNESAITTTTEISSTQTSTQPQLSSTTVKPTTKPTAKATKDKKPEATKSNSDLLMSSFPNLNANSAPHPLLSRIMLTAPLRPMQMPIFMQRNVNRNANKNANPMLGIASPVFRRRKHVKRSAARIDDEDKVFVSPKPFEKFACSPGEQRLGATRRPTLLQRYREMDSVEKAETKKVVVEKIMHGVNIASHIDGYITNTVKSGVAAIHRALNGSE